MSAYETFFRIANAQGMDAAHRAIVRGLPVENHAQAIRWLCKEIASNDISKLPELVEWLRTRSELGQNSQIGRLMSLTRQSLTRNRAETLAAVEVIKDSYGSDQARSHAIAGFWDSSTHDPHRTQAVLDREVSEKFDASVRMFRGIADSNTRNYAAMFLLRAFANHNPERGYEWIDAEKKRGTAFENADRTLAESLIFTEEYRKIAAYLPRFPSETRQLAIAQCVGCAFVRGDAAFFAKFVADLNDEETVFANARLAELTKHFVPKRR